jgi:hypothetical protein
LTGKRGYFGSSGCLHMEKVDPRVLRISFCHLQASQSPAF